MRVSGFVAGGFFVLDAAAPRRTADLPFAAAHGDDATDGIASHGQMDLRFGAAHHRAPQRAGATRMLLAFQYPYHHTPAIGQDQFEQGARGQRGEGGRVGADQVAIAIQPRGLQ
jgi:hypothetical protein